MFGSLIEPIKALREATDDLTSQDLDRLFDDQLTTTITAVAVLETRLTAIRLKATAELDRRRVAETAGYTSTAAWLADHTAVAYGRARSDVGLARSLEQMPHTAAAFVAGDVDVTRVRCLAAAHATNPDTFHRDEQVLVESATTLTPRHLATAIDYWRQNTDRQRFTQDTDHLHRQRRLHISQTFGGMVRIDADLDPESGAIVATAIRSLVEPAARDGDGRTGPQRRSDALVEICRNWLDHADTPIHGTTRPHISVIVDYSMLTGNRPGRCELDDGTVITAETALRLACDAAISRIITNGPSQILDVGRTTRTIPAAIRRAIELRDRGCVWPGCDRPPRLCDVHHTPHWANGGTTSVATGKLLCRPHHTLEHKNNQHPPRPP